MHTRKITARIGAAVGSLILTSLLTACGSDSAAEQSVANDLIDATPLSAATPVGGGHPVTTGNPEATPTVATPSVQGATAPLISGTPATAARSGSAYMFQPAASDPNGDALTFSIAGKPAWASFDASTGRLTGTPTPNDQGNFGNISITASDGQLTASLAPFSILVSAASIGSATLSWTPPTTNIDGSALTNLAGYKIYYGSSEDALTNVIQVTNAGLTSYTVGNLSAGTHYFAITAYTADGIEGAQSAAGAKTMM